MPGIVGVLSNSGIHRHRHELSQMTQPLLREMGIAGATRDHTSRFAGERGGIASVFLPGHESPLAERKNPSGPGRIWMAVYGSVILTDDPAKSDPRPMAEQLIDRYRIGGLPAVCGLNGTYVLAIFENETGRLTLVKDRHGYSKLFYWHNRGRLMFATEYKSIAWHPDFPGTINPVAVADLFLYRTPMEGRTLFQEVHNLPPAGILTYQNGRLSIRTYWQPSFANPGGPRKTDEQYADEMYERMRLAVRRRAFPGTCLLLTGGLDSRIVAGIYQQEAPASGLQSVTLGMESGSDVIVGRQIASALGIPHHHLPVGTVYLECSAEENVLKSEAKNGAYASWIAAAVPFLRRHGFRYVMTGLSGNFISGRHLPRALLSARTLEQGVKAVEGCLYPYIHGLQSIMRPEVFRTAAIESAGTPERIFCSTGVENMIQRGDAFAFHFRVCTQSNTADSLSSAAMALEPFFDNDVVDYAIGMIDPQARARALFNLLLVQRWLPEAAFVEMGNTGRSLADEIAFERSSIRPFVERYHRKVMRRLFRRPVRRGGFSSIPHAEAIREGSRAFVTGLLDQTDTYDDFFDPPAVSNALEAHLSGQQNNYMLIDALVTFILWRQQFAARYQADGQAGRSGTRAEEARQAVEAVQAQRMMAGLQPLLFSPES